MADPAETADPAELVDRVIVARPRQELYAFWRDFTNLPRFMENVRNVTEVDSLSSLWTIAVADGDSTEWEFLVTDDEPGRMIAWSTSGHSPVKYSGRVEFEDTVPPGSTQVTTVVNDPAPAPLAHAHTDLVRFKQYMESEKGAGSDAGLPVD
jgi:uncharacterized membrane protein